MRLANAMRSIGAIVGAALLLLAGCGADPGPEQEQLASQAQALTNGSQVGSDDYSGIVAVQIWSYNLSDYYTICTGTLLANTVVITAAHCLEDYQDVAMFVKMGSQSWQRRAVVNRYPNENSYDVALLRLQSPMLMWNWSYDHYVGGSAQLNNTDYRRNLYSGTNQSLNGKNLICLGYGGATPNGTHQPTLKAGALKATYPSTLIDYGRGDIPLVELAGAVSTEGGDSGGPCIDSLSMIGGSLTTILTSGGIYDSYGLGAGDFAWWASIGTYYILAGII
jgi:Trypsin